MNKLRKVLIGMMLAVALLGNSLSVSAANNGCQHTTISVYAKELAHREFLYSHTEQHGSVTVSCSVYKEYYNVRWKCVNCHQECLVTTEIIPEVHIN